MATLGATSSNPAKPAKALPGRRYDHIFFSAMSAAMLVAVFVGFAHTYYLAGVFHAPLPSLILHLHGAVFSCWILLLVAQTSLVSAGRLDIHRRLGIAGFLLAALMVILGLLAAVNALVRNSAPPGLDPKFFFIIPVTDILVFATLVFFAFRNRFNSAAHKRLILVATSALMTAAIARWPLPLVHGNAPMALFLVYFFLLILMAYDYWSTRKIHRATLWACVFLVLICQLRLPIGQTSAWNSFAGSIQSAAR